MTKYVYFLSKLYLPAPVTARAKKMKSNSKGWDATAKVSPLARCEINATNIVNASTKAAGLVNSPIMIKIAPAHSAATAEKPQKEVAKVIPILCIAAPIFSQLDGPIINLGMP